MTDVCIGDFDAETIGGQPVHLSQYKMAKTRVNGSAAHPLYKWLTREAHSLLGSQSIKWNFTKFLVGKDGAAIQRYAPLDKPESLKGDIEAALAR